MPPCSTPRSPTGLTGAVSCTTCTCALLSVFQPVSQSLLQYLAVANETQPAAASAAAQLLTQLGPLALLPACGPMLLEGWAAGPLPGNLTNVVDLLASCELHGTSAASIAALCPAPASPTSTGTWQNSTGASSSATSTLAWGVNTTSLPSFTAAQAQVSGSSMTSAEG